MAIEIIEIPSQYPVPTRPAYPTIVPVAPLPLGQPTIPREDIEEAKSAR